MNNPRFGLVPAWFAVEQESVAYGGTIVSGGLRWHGVPFLLDVYLAEAVQVYLTPLTPCCGTGRASAGRAWTAKYFCQACGQPYPLPEGHWFAYCWYPDAAFLPSVEELEGWFGLWAMDPLAATLASAEQEQAVQRLINIAREQARRLPPKGAKRRAKWLAGVRGAA